MNSSRAGATYGLSAPGTTRRTIPSTKPFGAGCRMPSSGRTSLSIGAQPGLPSQAIDSVIATLSETLAALETKAA